MIIPKTQVTIVPSKDINNKDKFFFLADANPPKDVQKAFFFNIDNVVFIQIRTSSTKDFSKTSGL